MRTVIQHFRLQLSPADQMWFEGAWRDFDGGACTYNESLDPGETLEHAERVWGGQMLPDTIPLLTNGAGDYLCARFTHDGTLSEVIEWLHEGARWRHYGRSINEAVAFDQMEYRQSGDVRDSEKSQLPAGLSPVAVSETACEKALMSQLEDACRHVGGTKLARLVGVSWEEFRAWLRDPSRIPEPKCEQLATALGINQREMVRQDWDTALLQAQSVLNLRVDLAWPYVVAGQAFERRGCPDDAVAMYKAGAMKLGSSSSFTALWSFVPHSATGKFAVDRLLTLASHNLEASLQKYVNATVERKTRNFWLNHANAATEQGDHRAAYQYLYAAGWDYYHSNDILEILHAMKASAKLAGSHTLGAILALHIDNLS